MTKSVSISLLCFCIFIFTSKVVASEVENVLKTVDSDLKLSFSSDETFSNVSRVKKQQGIYFPNNREPLEVGDLNYNGNGFSNYNPQMNGNPQMYMNTGNRYVPPSYRTHMGQQGQIPNIGPNIFGIPPPGPIVFDYVLTADRLKLIRSKLMYPYSDTGGDDGYGDWQKDIHDSTPKIHKNFNFQLPFFGFRYNYTRLSMHGFLEFSDPPEHYTYPLVFPNRDWPKKNDPAFIGIFFSKCRIGEKRETIDPRPGIYFRQERDLMARTDQDGVEMRERLKADLREGVVGADNFIPKHAVVVTWKNMSFAGGIDNSLYITNTFQLVLATDEVFTYAIFNYLDLQWTSHTEAGGDTTGGEGGTPAFVGFNAGNGTRAYEYKPYSQASTIRDLTGRGYWGNNNTGRHIFRIDENILPGTCNKDIAGTRLKLTFAPESGNMLGGTAVNITGPCFKPDTKIRCKFDIENVEGVVIDTNRATCVQPFLMAQGYVLFEVAIDDGAYNWKGKYFVETPATATQKIFFETKAVHEKYPKEIMISWNKYNLTRNANANVKISLWGYKETTIRPELLYIDLLEDNVPNTGLYRIDPSMYTGRRNYAVNDLRVGFIHITLSQGDQPRNIAPVLWSRPIPLAWYFASQWEDMYGKNWADRMCNDWIMNDRYLKNFAADIPQCPCTLEQALVDKGRFMPDYSCDRDSNPDCHYHKGAIHCVRTGSPSMEGSEQQCCYDKNHNLMLSYDQQWGSRPRRSHNLGYIPWNEANKVPTLSQWFHDMSPFYFCCLWQEEQSVGCETFRFERRPSQDCVAYQGPGVATAFGDPHIITFDDVPYTFNGKGEFVLVHTDPERFKFDVQARFEQLANNSRGEVGATQITSIAARDNTSSIIEVRLRPRWAQWRYRLDVFVDGRRVYFDRSALRVQHFSGVTVYTPLYVLDQHEVIIMFQSGAGVEVIENKGFMTVRVYLPWQFINQTSGLFGNWNFDKFDDLLLPGGGSVNIPINQPNTFREYHEQFAINWLLVDREEKEKGSSLFVHESGRTASYFADRGFQPEFRQTPQQIIPQNRSKEWALIDAFCGNSYQCKYDYAVSSDRDMAYYTLMYQAAFSQIKKTSQERVITCGILETPRFGRKSNFLFTPGTKVTFECNQGYILIGDPRRTCTSSGRWDPPLFGYTECLREEEYDMRAIGSTTLFIILILLPLLLLFLCVASYAFRKYRRGESIESWNYITSSRRASLRGSVANLNLQQSRDTSEQQQPLSDLSSPTSTSSGSDRKSRPLTYDGVYLTNEPIPGKPLVEFEPKVWDITEDDVFSIPKNSRPTSTVGSLQNLAKKFSGNPVKKNGKPVSPPSLPAAFVKNQNLPESRVISQTPSPSSSSTHYSTRASLGSQPASPQASMMKRSQSIETDIF
ncbi:hypothetical protein LSTR_LSTR013817 [Laodelphax striatellus]|uniref:Protein mesh n=1 Tax=Laodelphax striatellus TaxID=195883 RepID=A0A482XM79_LAOST|nr:hypothetical protein LSTR_LSTR013817 [Laodelphax striatellus]